MSKKATPTPYRDGAKAYRGRGLGQAIPVHPTENNQPAKGLIGFDAPLEGDAPREREKQWRTLADMLPDGKAEVKARTRDQKTGRWNLGIHPAGRVIALDVDEAAEFRAGLARHNLGLPPATIYSTARGGDSPRRQLVYRLPEGVEWVSDGKMPGGEIIDHAHRFIRAWPSVHLKTGNTYEWYGPDGGDALGTGYTLPEPPTFDELTELPMIYVERLRAAEAARPRKKDKVDVDEWIAEREKGKASSDLLALAEAVPTEGIDNNDVIRYLGPLVRAAWDSPGGGHAVREGIERYSGGYGRDAERAAYRAVANAIIDEQSAREARTMRVTFDLAPAPRAAKRKKAKKPKKGKKPKKLEHDEYTPSGVIGVTEPPAKPLDVAADLLAQEVLPPLLFWRGTWYIYAPDHWRTAEVTEIENLLYAALENATWLEYGAKGPQARDWSPTSTRVREVLRALQSKCTLARDTEAPAWLDGSRKSTHLVPARDCLLDPTTGEVHPRSCRFFSTGYVDAPVAVEHARPKRWMRFLDQLWGDDAESIALLQEWLGYLISGDTRRHKGFMMIGPKRSGKGTILHIAEALVGGAQGAFGATMSSFSGDFGLELAEGRSLLTMGDLRGSGREAATAAQKMLEIIGGDSVYINRKGRQAITTPLRTRVMIATNSMPKLYDDAGVVESRFLILRMTRSFAEHEDLDLLDKLLPELGGIVQWALEGYRRLEKAGRFTTPASDADDRMELRQNSAPVTEFLADACIDTDDVDAETPRREVWQAYVAWCQETGSAQMDQQQFGPALAGSGHPAHRPRTGDGTRGVWKYRGLQLRDSETAAARAQRLWGSDTGVVTQHKD
jgi:putative DNA primase/helicase